MKGEVSALCEKKMDPRVYKTKKSMSTAMFQLLEQNHFERITVNDICRTAMVSRTTFYQHFPDKYELVKYTLEQDGEELLRRTRDQLPLVIHGLLSYVRENNRVFENLFTNGVNQEMMGMLSKMAVANLKRDLEAKTGANGGVPTEIAAVFLSGGIAALLLWWIKSGCAPTAEEMAEHMMAMFQSRSAAV